MAKMNKKVLAIISAIIIVIGLSGVVAYQTLYNLSNINANISNSTATINNSTINIGENNTIIYPNSTPTPTPTMTATPSPTTVSTTTPSPTPEPTIQPTPTATPQPNPNLTVQSITFGFDMQSNPNEYSGEYNIILFNPPGVLEYI